MCVICIEPNRNVIGCVAYNVSECVVNGGKKQKRRKKKFEKRENEAKTKLYCRNKSS